MRRKRRHNRSHASISAGHAARGLCRSLGTGAVAASAKLRRGQHLARCSAGGRGRGRYRAARRRAGGARACHSKHRRQPRREREIAVRRRQRLLARVTRVDTGCAQSDLYLAQPDHACALDLPGERGWQQPVAAAGVRRHDRGIALQPGRTSGDARRRKCGQRSRCSGGRRWGGRRSGPCAARAAHRCARSEPTALGVACGSVRL